MSQILVSGLQVKILSCPSRSAIEPYEVNITGTSEHTLVQHQSNTHEIMAWFLKVTAGIMGLQLSCMRNTLLTRVVEVTKSTTDSVRQ